jgi:hypothetical protein
VWFNRAVRFLLLLGVFLVGAAPVSARPTLGVVQSFRTPSGNIGCVYSTAGIAGHMRASVRCDIRSGLKPRPARPRNCDLDYGDSYEITTTGRAVIVCHGDTALDPHARVVAYGTTWRRGALVCNSKSVGLRCSNRSGHGFFLSRGHSYRF